MSAVTPTCDFGQEALRTDARRRHVTRPQPPPGAGLGPAGPLARWRSRARGVSSRATPSRYARCREKLGAASSEHWSDSASRRLVAERTA